MTETPGGSPRERRATGDPAYVLLEDFKHDLREVTMRRPGDGEPPEFRPFQQISKQTGLSATTANAALTGTDLRMPSESTVRAIAQRYDSEGVAYWLARRERVEAHRRSASAAAAKGTVGAQGAPGRLATFLRRHWRAAGVACLSVVIIPLLLDWTGITDWRPFGGSHASPDGTEDPPASPDSSAPESSSTPSPSSPTPSPLSPNSPVRVTWAGTGDRIVITWDPMTFRRLHNYSVNVYGLAPLETDYNVGYRLGGELRTTVETNPVAETNEDLAAAESADRVDEQETWRVCVYGMRDAPLGVDISTYIIDGSTICSDPFNIPQP
jgi:hypothetical protein